MARKKTPPSPPALAVERLKVADLHSDPANVRKHPERNLAGIKASLARFKQQRPILIDGDNIVRAGNGTLMAAIDLGWTEIDCVRTPLRGVEATAYAIADNRTAELAEWDDQGLAETLRAIQSEPDFDLAAIGYNADEVDALCARLGDDLFGDPAEAPEPQIDRADELREKWKVESGQLWIIPSLSTPGKEHRLLCGDSTKAEDVARVMGGEKAALCFTSPPYAQQRDYEGGIGDWDTLMQGVFGNLLMADDGQVLVNLGLFYRDGDFIDYWSGWLDWMKIQGWRKFGWYIWDKISGPPGDWCGRCAPTHEWIFHFNRKAKEVNHIIEKKPESIKLKTGSSLRYADGSLHTANYSPESGLNTHKIPDSVWRFHVARTGGKVEVNHPAVYPTDLPAFASDAFSQAGDAMYEPFSGSGTTIVAAEQTGRLCRGVEIAPKYVAVALERLAGMGLTPAISMSSP